VGIYWPRAGEADLLPLGGIGSCALALPAVRARVESPNCLNLVYLPWRPGDRLQPDACSIPAPSPPAGPEVEQALTPEQLSLLLVPALAIDRCGYRLGYGGGWYDRLRSDPAWRKVPSLVVLPAGCLSEALPHDPWDIPFQGWIDEQGPHWCK
jgi:5-formyltetrahydrofolate cyclo-ligase